MNAFVNSVENQETVTENGMKTFANASDACVDLFYKIGASRGKNILPDFVKAFAEERALALRIVKWARDAREGAGERQLFKDIVLFLETNDPAAAKELLKSVPELGRYDDLILKFKTADLQNFAFEIVGKALNSGNKLCGKWMPREKSAKKDLAIALRTYLGLTPKQYRKSLVQATNVVESQMCAGDWNNINFSHVPSLASARYKKAFSKKATVNFVAYLEALKKGDPTVKVNAAAVYPYDIIKGWNFFSATDVDHANAQWAALENYVGEASILPLVDVSGSMSIGAGGSTSVTCKDVALSLGLYLSDKNKGAFKDVFATFSSKPQLLKVSGTIVQKLQQMDRSDWDMNTNIVATFSEILKVAVKGKVPQEDMPKILLILSDMQFDQCARFDDSAFQSMKHQYQDAGYEVPNIVFWNLNAKNGTPVKAHQSGAALVSGFSPAIMKSILSTKLETFSPKAMMLEAVMKPRYD